jgi:hypothetical protein
VSDITIYRWEYHFRASTMLGIVGAGGTGFELIAALQLIAYDQRVRESYHDLGLCCGAGKPGRSAAKLAEAVRRLQHM